MIFRYGTRVRHGPDGEPGLLADIADQTLVAEAMRLQQERQFDQGDIWRVFSFADPERALRGLRLAAEAGHWEVSAWRELLWATTDKGDDALQFELAGILLVMPKSTLAELLPAAASWLQKRRPLLANGPPGGPTFFPLWDRFADLAYGVDPKPIDDVEDGLLDQALTEPAGSLAWTLLEEVSESRPAAGTRLTLEQSSRLTRAVRAAGLPGLFARVVVVRSLTYLESIDHEWASTEIIPYLDWDQPQAAAMWNSRAYDHHVGSAQLFNSLKTPMSGGLRTPRHVRSRSRKSDVAASDVASFSAQATGGDGLRLVSCRN